MILNNLIINILQNKKPMIRYAILIMAMLIWVVAMVRFERVVFKRSGSFCPHFFLTNLPSDTKWDLPPMVTQDPIAFEALTHQKFSYLKKGAHCFAFVSQDGQYVMKLHRYPSTLRLFPWLRRPWSYWFNHKQQQHYLDQLDYLMQSYTGAFYDLKEESGILLMHLNRSEQIRQSVTLIDKGGTEHRLSLDPLTFIVQKRARLIYPTLTHLYTSDKMQEAEQVVIELLDLIASDYRKGYLDLDPFLHRNYGLLGTQAMHIDIGDLVKNPDPLTQQGLMDYVLKISSSLKHKIEEEYPKLLPAYQQKIQQLSIEPLITQEVYY